jgi:hypothetical protein
LAWRETDFEDTDLETVILDLLQCQYSDPVRIIGFNLLAGWVGDVSQDVALELRVRCADQGRESPEFLQGFFERCESAKA